MCLPKVVVVVAGVVRVIVLCPVARRCVLRSTPLYHIATVLLSLSTASIRAMLLKRERSYSVVGGIAGHLEPCCGPGVVNHTFPGGGHRKSKVGGDGEGKERE